MSPDLALLVVWLPWIFGTALLVSFVAAFVTARR